MRLLFLPGAYTAPAARFRIWQFVEPLRALGHSVSVRVIFPERYWVSPLSRAFVRLMHNRAGSVFRMLSAIWLLRDASRFDVIFINRDIVPEIKVSFLEPWLARRNPRLIFDFDDAIFLGERAAKLKRILPDFALVTAGNEFLANFARQHNAHVVIWPTVVDTERYKPATVRQPGPIRIGWSGSKSTLRHSLPLIKDVIVELSQQNDFEFVIIADDFPERWPGVKMRYIRWCPATEVTDLQQFDIGLMPLVDSLFERGKCGAKLLLYGAIGIPALASPVGVNHDIVLHGKTGFHCSTEADWIHYLELLISDVALRRRLGGSGRQRMEKYYSIQFLLPEMIRAFQQVA